ncbi:MAG: deoxyribodipyrimidine photolyase [Dehalococcoidia bacterium]
MTVPPVRVRRLNAGTMNAASDYVLYWMTSYRRAGWNFALQRAVDHALELRKPLLVLEALRCDYEWASDRLHSFVLEGMVDNERRFQECGIAYYPYVEPEAGAGKGLLRELSGRACVVVTDDFPSFFLPRAVATAAKQVAVLLEQVDSVGILPMRDADRAFPTAYAFRRFLQQTLPARLEEFPEPDSLARAASLPAAIVPEEIRRRWPPMLVGDGASVQALVASLPIDHSVGAVKLRGGEDAVNRVLVTFVGERLDGYAGDASNPGLDATSGLSPYLHFGHISSHQVLRAVLTREEWHPGRISGRADGRRSGWWGLSAPAEAFLDQLITWRELGFNFCHVREDYDRIESLPLWARETLQKHAVDPRPHLYSRQELEVAETHDPVWNGAQRQLLHEGRIHNYLRMLWGKKILEWTASPQEALDVMIHLNNKYALDGRDPNSYSGIFWCLGRYDRPWGPERPIFGKARYMSSENTRRKFRLDMSGHRKGI